MKCQRCRADNEAGRRFCGACGAPLPRACGRCGFANDPADRFCGGCGADLTEGPDPVETSGERRQVTVLFADLSGSTDLARRLDAEDMRDLLGKVLDVIDCAVASHGGTIDKHMGDGAMALFGAPIAHGDDPLRAVHAAAAIHRQIHELAAAAGQPLAVHVGIAAGEVVAGGVGRTGRSDYTVIGESVNLAARLLALAGPGETLLTTEVRDRVADRLPLVHAGNATPRGLDRPIDIWRMAEGGSLAMVPPLGPFVGRAAELTQIAAILDACRAGGGGQVVVLRGDAGIGKTRLVERTTEEAVRRGFRAHQSFVLDFGAGKGQDAIRALARSLIGVAPDGDKGARAVAADAAQAKAWITEVERGHLDDLLDLTVDPARRALVDAMDLAARVAGRRATLGALVRGAAAEAPRLVAVEDIHWAKPGTITDLADLAGAVALAPAILVLTTRLEGDPITVAWRAAAGSTPVTTIDLRPLRRDEAVSLARAVIATGAGPIERCVERAEGNPLFLVQLLQHTKSLAGDEVPGTIQSLVLARVDRLPAADRKALQAASAIGQRLRLDVLRHVAGEAAYRPDVLVAHGLMRTDGATLLFAHALIRDGVYGSLVRARRRALHGLAAGWYAGRDPVLHAEHLARAESPDAAAAYLRVAEQEARALRPERALALAEAGLAVAADDEARRALALARGEALLDLGRPRDALAAFADATSGGDPTTRCRVLLGLAEAKRLSDDLIGAFAALDQAEPVARDNGLVAVLARLESLRGNLHFPRGEIVACRAAHGRALIAARAAGSVEDEARALGGLADAAYAAGHITTARGHLEDCLALCSRHGFLRIEAANRPMYGLALFCALELRSASEQGELTVELARRIGHRRAEIVGEHGLHLSNLYGGRFEAARRHAQRGVELARDLGAARFEAEGHAMLAAAAFAMGDRATARACIAEALAVARASGMAYWGPIMLAWAARLDDDPAAARRALDEAEALLAAGSLFHNHVFFAIVAIDRALDTGAWDEAMRLADRLTGHMAREPLAMADFFADRARALARHGSGDRSDALRLELSRLATAADAAGLHVGRAELERALVG